MSTKSTMMQASGVIHRHRGRRPLKPYVIFFIGSVVATIVFIVIAESPRFQVVLSKPISRDSSVVACITRNAEATTDKNGTSPEGNSSIPYCEDAQTQEKVSKPNAAETAKESTGTNATVIPTLTVTTTTKPMQIVQAPRNSGIRKFEANLMGGEVRPDYGELPAHFRKILTPEKIVKTFTIRPRAIEDSDKFYFIIFMVKSTCARMDRRENVRKTWGAITTINGQRFGVVFLVGKSANEEQQKAITAENEKYGDILQSDVGDGYRELPDKVLSGYQWVHYGKPNISDFYGFTDDDCMINLPRTFDYFMSNRKAFLTSETIYCGFIYNPLAHPIRGASKYAIATDLFPNKFYPPFCHGGMSVLAKPLLSDLYRMAEMTNRSGFHLEDVYISAILRTKLGRGQRNIKPINHVGTQSVFKYNLGPFSWHLGLSRDVFVRVWRIVFNMMTVAMETVTHTGFWHTAKTFKATATSDVIVPSDDNIAQYFKENFATVNR